MTTTTTSEDNNIDSNKKTATSDLDESEYKNVNATYVSLTHIL